MKQTPVITRRKFDESFNRQALENLIKSGKSGKVIAQELLLKANRLYAWKKTKPHSLADLRRERKAAELKIRYLQEQRDIVIKILGTLSERSPKVMNGSPVPGRKEFN